MARYGMAYLKYNYNLQAAVAAVLRKHLDTELECECLPISP